ncbi:MAG TPA: alpha/beta family hydrolase [Casimicrobiaceae bacterium]|nr:alpha/beta family hydrolase [Casimicrobiaceae bacterium]
MRQAQQWDVAIGDDHTRAVFEPARRATGTLFVFAHGAGGNRDDKGMLALDALLHDRGIDTVRFNFVYREKGSRRPDRMPQLEACISAVVDRARRELKPARTLIGGRSMGGRAASMLAAQDFDCNGLLLFAYPLHPADEPEKLRDQHLPRVVVPTLCFNGTRDPLCRHDLMEHVLARVGSNWTMHWLRDADHSFHVLRTSGRTDADVLSEVGATIDAWLPTLSR